MQEELECQYPYWEGGMSSSDWCDPDSYKAQQEARRWLREEQHKQMEELRAECFTKSEYQPQGQIGQITTVRLVMPEEEPERQVTSQEERERQRPSENAEPKENGLG